MTHGGKSGVYIAFVSNDGGEAKDIMYDGSVSPPLYGIPSKSGQDLFVIVDRDTHNNIGSVTVDMKEDKPINFILDTKNKTISYQMNDAIAATEIVKNILTSKDIKYKFALNVYSINTCVELLDFSVKYVFI